MRLQGLNVLYHSPVTLPALRAAIVEAMVSQGALQPGEEPPRERVYPPVGTLALDLLYDVLHAEASSFRELDGRPAPAAGHRPVPASDRGAIHVLRRRDPAHR